MALEAAATAAKYDHNDEEDSGTDGDSDDDTSGQACLLGNVISDILSLIEDVTSGSEPFEGWSRSGVVGGEGRHGRGRSCLAGKCEQYAEGKENESR